MTIRVDLGVPDPLGSTAAAADSSHCAAAPVEIICLSAACLSPGCQPTPAFVYLQFAFPQSCQQSLISPFSVLLILAHHHMPNAPHMLFIPASQWWDCGLLL